MILFFITNVFIRGNHEQLIQQNNLLISKKWCTINKTQCHVYNEPNNYIIHLTALKSSNYHYNGNFKYEFFSLSRLLVIDRMSHEA